VNTLSRFENLVERLVEGSFERLFKTHLHPADLAKALASAMEQGLVDDGRGGAVAPNVYRVLLNPIDYLALQHGSDLTAEVFAIQRYLFALMSETNSTPASPVQVTIQPDDGIDAGRIKIAADHMPTTATALPPAPDLDDTKRFESPVTPPADRWIFHLPDRTVPLGMPIIRIGRDAANDICVSDPTVSRYHAQLRWQNGVYYVQNLSHTQPLGLNRRPVQGSMPLKPGDTLQLGQVIAWVGICQEDQRWEVGH